MFDWFDGIDRRIAGDMEKYGILLLRISLGVIFIWFGALKLFDGLSPAEELVKRTVYWFSPEVFFPILGLWEVLIGVGLLFDPCHKDEPCRRSNRSKNSSIGLTAGR